MYSVYSAPSNRKDFNNQLPSPDVQFDFAVDKVHLGDSKNRASQCSTLNSRILLIRPPKYGTPIFGNSHLGICQLVGTWTFTLTRNITKVRTSSLIMSKPTIFCCYNAFSFGKVVVGGILWCNDTSFSKHAIAYLYINTNYKFRPLIKLRSCCAAPFQMQGAAASAGSNE